MNESFPPLSLTSPQVSERRRERPHPVPIPPEVIARRREIAHSLAGSIAPLSRSLRQMSEEERRALFYKIEHDGPLPFAGIGLKSVVEPSDGLALAIPRSDNLDSLIQKIRDFGEGKLQRGHAPNEQLGAALMSIQRGEPADRLSQALFEDYDDLVGQDWVICEIEMVSLRQGRKQQEAELRDIRRDLEAAFSGGTCGHLFEHEEIKGTCRAVIRCTGSLFREFVEGDEWQRKIWWFDARPEFETFHATLRDFDVNRLGELIGPAETAPLVCIVDSGVTSGNAFLAPVTKQELLRSFLSASIDVPYDEHGHGSGVASLATYYALNLQDGASNQGRIWIASARVLDANNEAEENRLFSKVLTEVVDVFVPLGVRIFNLSINILNRKWNEESKRTVPRRSWVARTIDRLCWKHDIVFVISTGNIQEWQVRAYIQNGQHYPAYFADEDASAFDPGQSALALTVGALSPTTLVVGRTGSASAMAARNQPAPFTRCGPGIVREVKPELVDYGGNYLYDHSGGVVRSNPGTDVMMASHQLTPAISHGAGTSFACPRVAYKLGIIMEDLHTLGVSDVSAPLLKAFAVNSARWWLPGDEDEFEEFKAEMEAIRPKHWLNVVGYGMPDHNFATYCDEHSAVLFFQGALDPDKVAYFDIPVPASLAEGESGTKRLTITVVYAPEVQRWGLETYLGTRLKWRLFRGDIGRDEIIAAMSVEEGTDDVEESPDRPGELKGKLGITLRSRGAVQHDIVEWSRHHEDYSVGHYTLAITSYEKWGRSNPPAVPYAVVVRLEDTTQTTQVYAEVQSLLAQIEVRARAST